MSNYIFLMQYYNTTHIESADTARMMLTSQIGSGISLIGCVMTLSMLCFLDVRGDGLFNIGNMSIVMMAAQLSFIGAENTYPHPVMCKLATCILLYFFLAIHFSSLSFGLHLWTRLTAGTFPCEKRTLYLLLTWVAPGVVVIVTTIIRGNTFASDNLCWVPYSNHTRLAFLVPVTVVLFINTSLYVRIISARFRHDYNKGRKISTILKNAFMATMSMFPSLNLPWLLGYSVTFDLHKGLQYTYVILCSGQGLLVFMMHVLTTGQVKKAIFAKLAEAESDSDFSSDNRGPRGPRTKESDAGEVLDSSTLRSRIKVEPKKDT